MPKKKEDPTTKFKPSEIFEFVVAEAQTQGVLYKKSQQAIRWYLQLINQLNPATITYGDFDRDRKQGNLQFGEMTMYVYQAKYAKELPYWDRFPLVFPVGPAPGGIYGLNMHYLPIPQRINLMSKLYQLRDRDYGEDMRLKLSYGTLMGFTKTYKALSEVAFKHYLFTQMRSRFVHINAAEWPVALFLPTADWQKKSESAVHADVARKIKELKKKK